MSAVDDSGEVRVCEDVPFRYTQQSLDGNATKQPKVFYHADPETQALASCAVFKPRVNDIYLASCGTDCMIKLWDVSKPR